MSMCQLDVRKRKYTRDFAGNVHLRSWYCIILLISTLWKRKNSNFLRISCQIIKVPALTFSSEQTPSHPLESRPTFWPLLRPPTSGSSPDTFRSNDIQSSPSPGLENVYDLYVPDMLMWGWFNRIALFLLFVSSYIYILEEFMSKLSSHISPVTSGLRLSPSATHYKNKWIWMTILDGFASRNT